MNNNALKRLPRRGAVLWAAAVATGMLASPVVMASVSKDTSVVYLKPSDALRMIALPRNSTIYLRFQEQGQALEVKDTDLTGYVGDATVGVANNAGRSVLRIDTTDENHSLGAFEVRFLNNARTFILVTPAKPNEPTENAAREVTLMRLPPGFERKP